MNKRIVKKVLKDPKRYHKTLVDRACKRLGESVMILGVDKGAEGTTDYTVMATYNMDAATTGRVSSFRHRTGNAPKTEGAVLKSFRAAFDEAQASGVPFIAATSMRYEDMTLPQLKEAAKAKGLSGYSTLKKADLVALLEGAAQ